MPGITEDDPASLETCLQMSINKRGKNSPTTRAMHSIIILPQAYRNGRNHWHRRLHIPHPHPRPHPTPLPPSMRTLPLNTSTQKISPPPIKKSHQSHTAKNFAKNCHSALFVSLPPTTAATPCRPALPPWLFPYSSLPSLSLVPRANPKLCWAFLGTTRPIGRCC